ncbi:MAG: hypothetical protein BJ554DRAFT_2275, partial [Olpidium bornovanus]
MCKGFAGHASDSREAPDASHSTRCSNQITTDESGAPFERDSPGCSPGLPDGHATFLPKLRNSSTNARFVVEQWARTGRKREAEVRDTVVFPRRGKEGADVVLPAAFPRDRNPVTDLPGCAKHIQFGVLSAAQMLKLSEFEVTHNMLYSSEERGPEGQKVPLKGGLLDRRLLPQKAFETLTHFFSAQGTTTKNDLCGTCGMKDQECSGHYGHVTLALPVFHIGYFKAIITILQDICKTCSRVLLEEADRRSYLKRFRTPRLENITRRTLVKGVNDKCRKLVYCPYCNAINGPVKKVGPLKIVHEKFRAKKTAEEHEAFKKTFEASISFTPDIKNHLSKAQDDLN